MNPSRYPYGYGRAEDLAGIFILLAILTSAGLAGWQSYDKLVSGRGTTHLTLGMLAAAIGIVGNQLVARYKGRVGREIKSAPLIVDARHSRLDAAASAGALAGMIGVALGRRVADPIAGFAITLLIIHIGIDATKDVASRLMDENDEEVAEAIRAVAEVIPGVAQVSEVRARWLGREVEARILVRLPATMGSCRPTTSPTGCRRPCARRSRTCARSWSSRRRSVSIPTQPRSLSDAAR